MSEQEIFKAIPSIMAEMDAVSKDAKNKEQGYSYRSIDSIYNHLQKLMAKYGVFSVPQRINRVDSTYQTKSGSLMRHSVITFEYTFFAKDGSSVKVIIDGEGADNSDKVSGKCAAYAHKYALMQLFAIPTDEIKDPDATTPEGPEVAVPKKPDPKKPVKPFNMATLVSLVKKKGIKTEDLSVLIKKMYQKESSKEMTSQELQEFYNLLQNNDIETLLKFAEEHP